MVSSISPKEVASLNILFTKSIFKYFLIVKSFISISFITKSSSLNFSFFSVFFNKAGPSLAIETVAKQDNNK